MARKKQPSSTRCNCPAAAQPANSRKSAPPSKRVTALRDFIAPSSLNFQHHFQLGTRYARTYYVYGYPRQLYTGWLSSMVNLDEVMDMSMYIYPVESQVVLENLRKESDPAGSRHPDRRRKGPGPRPGQAGGHPGRRRNARQAAGRRRALLPLWPVLHDLRGSMDELEFVSHKVEVMLGQQLVYSKPATSQQEQG
jgi:conjugal transfer ATP-binding protein TraC